MSSIVNGTATEYNFPPKDYNCDNLDAYIYSIEQLKQKHRQTKEKQMDNKNLKEYMSISNKEFNNVCANATKPVHDAVDHPSHYEREGAIECIDEMQLLFTKEEVMAFCKLNAWKYRYRAADKNGIEDIKKSDWYIRKYKELEETRKRTMCSDDSRR